MVLAGAIIWSLAGVVIKTEQSGLAWHLLIRGIAAGVCFLPFIFRRPIEPIRSALLVGVAYAALLFVFSVTTRMGSSAMAVSMEYAAPVYVIGYGFIKNKKVPRTRLVVFVLLLIGLVLNMAANFASSFLAILAGIGTGLTFLVYTYLLKKIKSGSPLGIVALANFVTAACALPFLPFSWETRPQSLVGVLSLIGAGVVISAISYALYRKGLTKIPMEGAMILCLAELLLNPVWVFFATGEGVSPIGLAGLVFIFFGALSNVFDMMRRPVATETVVAESGLVPSGQSQEIEGGERS